MTNSPFYDANSANISNNTTNIATLNSLGLKTIELDGNNDLRGKRLDGSYSGKI